LVGEVLCFYASARPLFPRHSWAIWVQGDGGNARDLAPFILAVEGKRRSCDLVGLKPQAVRPCVYVTRQEPWRAASVDATIGTDFPRNGRASRPRTEHPQNVSMCRTKVSQV